MNRRQFSLNTAAVLSGLCFGGTAVRATFRAAGDEITGRSLGLTPRAKLRVQRTAYQQLKFFEAIYGLDARRPFELKDGITTVNFRSDPLGIMPRKSEIAVPTPVTRAGQLHVAMAAVYRALHGNGEDGIADSDIYEEATRGVATHCYSLGVNVVTRSKSYIADAMKIKAGIDPMGFTGKKYWNVPLSIRTAQEGLEYQIRRLAEYEPGSKDTQLEGNYTKAVRFRLAKAIEYVALNAPAIDPKDPVATLTSLDRICDMFLGPEITRRAVEFFFDSQVAGGKVKVTFPRGDLWRKATSRLSASIHSYRLLFPELSLPGMAVYIPFEQDAELDYRIYFPDDDRTYCIPMHLAHGRTEIQQTRIPNLREYREDEIDLNALMPRATDIENGLVSAFDLAVGLSDAAVRSAEIDRAADLEKEAGQLGITILQGRPSDSGEGILLADRSQNSIDAGGVRKFEFVPVSKKLPPSDYNPIKLYPK